MGITRGSTAGTAGTNGTNGTNGAPGAMVQLADSLLGADTANFDFTSISGSYNHLLLYTYLRGTKAVTGLGLNLRFNNDSSAIYDWYRFYGSGSGSFGHGGVDNDTSIDADYPVGDSATTGFVGSGQFFIPNYAATTFFKSCTYDGFGPRAEGGSLFRFSGGGMWKSTAAITRITITPDANNWKAGSRVTLYGVL